MNYNYNFYINSDYYDVNVLAFEGVDPLFLDKQSFTYTIKRLYRQAILNDVDEIVKCLGLEQSVRDTYFKILDKGIEHGWSVMKMNIYAEHAKDSLCAAYDVNRLVAHVWHADPSLTSNVHSYAVDSSFDSVDAIWEELHRQNLFEHIVGISFWRAVDKNGRRMPGNITFILDEEGSNVEEQRYLAMCESVYE